MSHEASEQKQAGTLPNEVRQSACLPADLGGFASPSLPTGEGEAKLPLTAPPNTPKTATHVCRRDNLFEEIFGIVKLGPEFAVALAGSEGAKVSQPDTATLFQFVDDGFKDGFEDGIAQAL